MTPEQAVFRFNTDTTLLPEVRSGRILRKAVQAVHAYPANVEMTMTTRRVLNALCVYAQDTFAIMSDEQRALIKDRNVRGTPVFRIQIGRLKTMIEQSSNDNERIYQALDNLYRWEFRYNVMGDVDGETQVLERVQSRFISTLGKGEMDGLLSGEVAYEIPNDVLLMILEPRIFAQIDMRASNTLGSAHAIALYENCVRYLGTQNKVTAVLPVQEWINLISGDGNYPDAYKQFKRFVLTPAIKWLEKNDLVPFTVEPLERRGPRNKMIALQFKLQLKKQPSLAMDMPPPSWSPTLLEVLKTVYSMSKRDISDLAKIATEDELQEAMSRDAVMIQRKIAAGTPVLKRADYLRGILRNVQTGKNKHAEPEVDAEELASKEIKQAMDRAKRMRDEFERFRVATIATKFSALGEDESESIRERFAQAKKADITVSSMIARGWDKAALKSIFHAWIKDQPDLVGSFLNRADEVDFEVWNELQRSAPGLTK